MRPSDLLGNSGTRRAEAPSDGRSGGHRAHLRDAVFGAIDGTVTTFAVVAGAIGADLSGAIILILGLANLFADGLSMAVGNYLGERADQQERVRTRAQAQRAVHDEAGAARAALQEHYAELGLTGDELARVVDTVTSNQEAWVETLMRARFGPPDNHRDPRIAALVIYFAFLGAGAMPLLVFIADQLGADLGDALFPLGIAATAITFFGVGAVKGIVVERPWWRDGLETLALGGAAASLAYAVGWLLRGIAEGA